MSRISTYFMFNGNCREAMAFYQECFGGELRLQTVGESPLADGLPEQMKGFILHASLRSGNLVLMGTDMVGEQGLVKGNAVSTLIDCSNEEELRACYDQLSRDGLATHPVKNTFWGALFGELTDRYGNHWLLNYTIKKPTIMTTQKI
ncbi:MAG: VOC family protein [Saprospiraceae bacterium]|nr:VOC family protein [Saprospiraceae bacterium]